MYEKYLDLCLILWYYHIRYGAKRIVSVGETNVEMTYEKLKKLNRLEILELLLEQSKLNEKLKQEIDDLKNKSNVTISSEKSGIMSTEKIESLTLQLTSALEYADSLTEKLKNIPETERPAENKVKENNNVHNVPAEQKNVEVTNKNLYGRIMYFFWQNDDVLSSLPDELQKDIRTKLRGILNDRK